MALPITQNNKTSDTRIEYIRKFGNRQKRPIDRPLEYEVTYGKVLANSGGDGSWQSTVRPGTLAENLKSECADLFAKHLQNTLYSRLKAKIQDSAALGVSLAEMGQSVNMIQTRATQLLKFGIKLKKLDFVGAAKELRLATVPKGASAKRSFANNYLEFHFGWSPLIGDIYSAAKVLESPVNDQFPVVSAKYTTKAVIPPAKYTGGFYARTTTGGSAVRAKMGCKVRVTNPNLNLVNQLGLANPLMFAYELFPFSFVANWFISIEEFLSQGTDLMGLTILDSWHSYGMSRILLQEKGNPFWGPQNAFTLDTTYYLRRRYGLVQPVFQVRPFKLWGWRRAAAAVSLVVQQTTTGPGRNRR